jgi:hypothetical protein
METSIDVDKEAANQIFEHTFTNLRHCTLPPAVKRDIHTKMVVAEILDKVINGIN